MTVRISANGEPALKKAFVLGIITLAAVAVTLVAATAAWAAADLLLMPAPKILNEMAVRAVFLDLAAAGDRQVAVGGYGLILYSDDGGTTWQQAEVPTSVTLTAVHFPTARKGWAVGHDGVVLHSEDGGQSWQIQLSGLEVNKKALAQIEQKKAEMSAALDAAPEEGRDALAGRLEEMELLLSDMSVPVEDGAPTPLMDVIFLDENAGYTVGAFGMILQTRDGGRSWAPIVDRMNNIDGYHYYGIERVRVDGKNVLFVAGEAGLLMRSTDGAASWQRLASPYEGTFFGVSATTGAQRVIAFGLGGEAYLSSDIGESWQRVEKPGSNNQSISGAAPLSDGGFLLTTNNGILYRIEKAGSAASRLAVQVPGSMAAAETGDGTVVVAGIMGVKRISITDRKGD